MRYVWICLKLTILVFCGQFQFDARAADAPVRDLSGVWGTRMSVEVVGTELEIHLLADGFGMMLGYAPARRADGVDDGKPAPLTIVAYPFRMTRAGNLLTLRTFPLKNFPEEIVPDVTVSCRHVQEGPSLACTGPAGPFVMFRKSKVVVEDLVRMIKNSH
jgi:hypothetical protein